MRFNFLNNLKKPGRYLGIEINSIHKNWSKEKIRIALCFPDLYEIGMSNLGIQILYSLVNKRKDSLAERVFAPYYDLEKLLKERKASLFSLESKRKVSEFDIVAFSLAYELLYTNLITILDLSHIELFSNKRKKKFPLIMGGGITTCNPEPVADFFDFFLIGEAEEAIDEILDVVKLYKGNRKDKQSLLKDLSKIEGVYVPSLYKIKYKSSGEIKEIVPLNKSVSYPIRKRKVDLKKAHFPLKPIIPLINSIHNRAVLELQRGCFRQCRFCQARVYFYPYRIREKYTLVKFAKKLIKHSGYNEISLSSLSSTDYPYMEELVDLLIGQFSKRKITFSLSSLRPGSFSLLIASKLNTGRKTTLTFAPEVANEQLRRRIGKDISNRELFESINFAKEKGWQKIKLYFMIGLPFEADKDIDEIIELIKEIRKIFPKLKLSITISVFVPKAQTPFQWVAQQKKEILFKKSLYLKDALPARVNISNVEMSFIEAVLSRGDRRLSRVIVKAWKNGARFDQFNEFFNYTYWQKAFKSLGINPEFYANRKRNKDEVFPWDHIDLGISKEKLYKEYTAAINI